MSQKLEMELYKTVLNLETLEECTSFFQDICTPAEIKALSERLYIAKLLYANELSYREISKLTGASLTTISRVARFLKHEANQGYVKILKKTS